MSFSFNYNQPKLIAEIGCNHMGDLSLAKDLINLCKSSGCTYVKFQKRNPKESLTKDQYNNPHPNANHSYGPTYGAHREFLEFSIDQHLELKRFCEDLGMVYSTSVWDVTSAKEVIQLKPDFIKVPSACNNHFSMLEVLRDNYKGDVHLSVGMTTKDEVESVVEFFEKTGDAKSRLVLYACTSGYPVSFEDVALLEINNLYNKFFNKVSAIGFSGHHLGIAIDIAAYTLGAQWIERHFTKDRTLKGTDHAASLEPSGLSKLSRDLTAVYQALNFKNADILEVEQVQRDKLKFNKLN